MDLFYLDELESLRLNLRAALGHWEAKEVDSVQKAWQALRTSTGRWKWDIGSLRPSIDQERADESDEEEEEGEYRPVVVET